MLRNATMHTLCPKPLTTVVLFHLQCQVPRPGNRDEREWGALIASLSDNSQDIFPPSFMFTAQPSAYGDGGEGARSTQSHSHNTVPPVPPYPGEEEAHYLDGVLISTGMRICVYCQHDEHGASGVRQHQARGYRSCQKPHMKCPV
eukprot:Tamp_10382.p1 GENE.Tamp_10382~~Tamp_10382.p1  ORF type:complete len:145 (-),score=3.17 Tamp_10382:627-1061(-)